MHSVYSKMQLLYIPTNSFACPKEGNFPPIARKPWYTNRCKVVIGIRPENIRFVSTKGDFTGKLLSKFYLGNVNDCRIELCKEIIQVIAEPKSFDTTIIGETYQLRIDEFTVFENAGDDSHTKILT